MAKYLTCCLDANLRIDSMTVTSFKNNKIKL